jgi:hypothetical protein
MTKRKEAGLLCEGRKSKDTVALTMREGISRLR